MVKKSETCLDCWCCCCCCRLITSHELASQSCRAHTLTHTHTLIVRQTNTHTHTHTAVRSASLVSTLFSLFLFSFSFSPSSWSLWPPSPWSLIWTFQHFVSPFSLNCFYTVYCANKHTLKTLKLATPDHFTVFDLQAKMFGAQLPH